MRLKKRKPVTASDARRNAQRTVARLELCHSAGALDFEVAAQAGEQRCRDADRAPLVAFRQRGREPESDLLIAVIVRANPRLDLDGQQRRGLFEPESGGDQEIGEQGVAAAIAIARARTFAAIDSEPAQSHVAEAAVVLNGDELDVGALGRTLVGLIARDDDRAPSSGRHPAPDITI